MSHYGYVSEQLLTGELFPTGVAIDAARAGSRRREPRAAPGFDVDRMRSHGLPATGRVPTNNAATPDPRELVDLYRRLSPWYESVHRGQSAASQRMTARFEESFEHHRHLDQRRARSRPTGTPPRPSTRSCTRCSPSSGDGDNVVTTLMEQLNFVPWYALCHDVLRSSAGAWSAAWSASTPRRASWTSPTWPSWSTSAPRSCASAGRPTSWGPDPRWTASARSRTPAYRSPRDRRVAPAIVDAAQLAPSTVIDVAATRVDPGVLLPQGAGAVRGRRPLRPRAAAGALAPVLLQATWSPRRGDPGHAGTARCPGSSPPGRPTSSGWSRARRRCGCWSTSRSTTGRNSGSRRRRGPDGRGGGDGPGPRPRARPHRPGAGAGREIPASASTGRPEACHAHRCWRSRSRAPIPAGSRPPWTSAASRRGPAATAPASPITTSAWSGRARVAGLRGVHERARRRSRHDRARGRGPQRARSRACHGPSRPLLLDVDPRRLLERRAHAAVHGRATRPRPCCG